MIFKEYSLVEGCWSSPMYIDNQLQFKTSGSKVNPKNTPTAY